LLGLSAGCCTNTTKTVDFTLKSPYRLRLQQPFWQNHHSFSIPGGFGGGADTTAEYPRRLKLNSEEN
jgi:hypothetical protein